jgi:hypothetical protein
MIYGNGKKKSLAGVGAVGACPGQSKNMYGSHDINYQYYNYQGGNFVANKFRRGQIPRRKN